MSGRGWQNLTAADIARMQNRGTAQAPTASKYKNVKVTVDGHRFDSKREAAIYAELKLREKAGEIRNLKLQQSFSLVCPYMHAGMDSGQRATVATYVADFTFEEKGVEWDGWRYVVADCKGGRNTAIFNLKKKWLFLQSGIDIREIR